MTHKIETPKVYEDPNTDFLMIGFKIINNPNEEKRMVGLGLLRNTKETMNPHYMSLDSIKQARRSTVRAALELNRAQMQIIVYRAQQILKLYNEYEICLLDEEIDPNLIAISESGVADFN
jgi:hypothetical protein